MRPSCRCTLLAATLLIPSLVSAQQRGIELGLDGGFQYSVDADVLAISIPFQRVRAAFPSGERLAFEPALSLTRLSSNGSSLTLFALEVGALYNFAATRTNTYARPFFGLQYLDDSFSDGTSAVELGIGIGSRSRIADRLALRYEIAAAGHFPEGGGMDALLGASVGLSFFTK
jgi:hypothetical protein